MIKELQSGDPAKVGPYRLIGRLGAGGMGRVYVARSPGGRMVAIKVIRAELAEDHGFRDRFAREIAAARGVSGIFTAAVIDADPTGEVPWMATAYVAGPSLADAVEEHGPLSADSVRALAAGLAEGLQAIHQAGLVHRDLKPSNVLLASDGPRVIDFGISRALEGSRLTETGMLVGSPGFMSPEQAMGLAVGSPSDVFSLGAVLAFAATGEGPFGAGPTLGLIFRVVHEPPDLTRVPGELRPMLDACLAKEPAGRPSPGQLLESLSEGVSFFTPDWLPAAVTGTFSQYVPKGQSAASGPQTAVPGQPASPPPAGYRSTGEMATSVDAPGGGGQVQFPGTPVPGTSGSTPAGDRSMAATAFARPPGATPPPSARGLDSMAALSPPGPVPPRRERRSKRWPLVIGASIASVAILAGVASALTLSSGGKHSVNTGQTTSGAPSGQPASLVGTSTATPSPTQASPTITASSTASPAYNQSATTSPTWSPTSQEPTTEPPTSMTPTPTDTGTPTPSPTTGNPTCSTGCTSNPTAGP